MRKKLLSLALALVLCLGLMPTPASAAGATVIEIISPDTYEQFYTAADGYVYSSGGMTNFTDGIAFHGSKFTGYGAFDTTGKIVIPPYSLQSPLTYTNGVAWLFQSGLWIAMDTSGNELFRLNPSDIGASSVLNFYDGLAQVKSSTSDLYGYLDMTGQLVLPIEYRAVGNFYDGLARIYDPASAHWGFMDKTGKVVIPYQYDSVEDFSNGYAKVKVGKTVSTIDTTGKVMNPPEGYSGWSVLSSELIRVSTNSGATTMYAIATKSGQVISDLYNSIENIQEGMFKVKKKTSGSSTVYNGCVNEAGVEVIPCTLLNIGDFLDGFAIGLEKSDDGNIYKIFDTTGKVTGTYPVPPRSNQYYTVFANAGNGFFKQFDDGSSVQARYGFIDYTGREIVPCKYKQVGSFSNGVAPVCDFSGKWGFVNTAGEEVVPCKLTELISRGDGCYQVKGFHDGDDRWSVVRGTGGTAPATASTPSTPAQTNSVSAAPTASTVLVNGKEVAFDAYNIGGANYFKLRDLAYVLSGTGKQFEVGWDNNTKTITLTSGQGYTAVGGEMASGASGNQTAVVSASKLLIDGKEVSFDAYTIGGSNYFKLRDIGQAFDFGIGWDNASKTITIDTSTGYTE